MFSSLHLRLKKKRKILHRFLWALYLLSSTEDLSPLGEKQKGRRACVPPLMGPRKAPQAKCTTRSRCPGNVISFQPCVSQKANVGLLFLANLICKPFHPCSADGGICSCEIQETANFVEPGRKTSLQAKGGFSEGFQRGLRGGVSVARFAQQNASPCISSNVS